MTQISANKSSAIAPIEGKNTGFPSLLYVSGSERRNLGVALTPFSIGRRPGKDLEISNARISRDHAEIVCDAGDYYIADLGSKLGTFVNRQRIQRYQLHPNDRIEFGVGPDVYLIFNPTKAESSVAREFLSQISAFSNRAQRSDLDQLALFLEAARKLNSTGALDEILASLIETTLKLTGAERGFVFLRKSDGVLKLRSACTAAGERLTSDETISHSILEDAARAASNFVISDTRQMTDAAERESIVAHDLRTVVAIPLRKAHVQTGDNQSPVLGVLYLDSHFASAKFSDASHDILGVIARQAAALVESTHLAQAEEASRRYQQELGIAAMIQQRLMNVAIPDLAFATLKARNVPCRDIGGDFFDVVHNEGGVTLVVTDVSGKGISAAILASILQGLLYAQITAGVPLAEIALSANRFLCQRVMGEKYATAIIVNVSESGRVEFVNCGHELPILVRARTSQRINEGGNVPLGLIEAAAYTCGTAQLVSGDRLVLVTDGVTEAEDSSGEFFGVERLQAAAAAVDGSSFEHILSEVSRFSGDTPPSDDCTLLELTYKGGPSGVGSATTSSPDSV